ncbi:2,4'-dihydroxyacetophenone dioxygenase family protein [Actinomadura barringtoniae]|uniref:2,4'-dihydroxyacetophenone dioxygenase family protein n=1 Tax=Actinomadura barringtoniae TaxID=1427535 RepID=A0A939P7V6_9ACTN|nr:2,4'-dihydroxyacetophenone dioxygenase family protein [Actinomadura barringtoniae]MBO2447320.1 2,4'-dihydroxyacetophenone dioxygenase family protein [Actinomadura barringtoniae]
MTESMGPLVGYVHSDDLPWVNAGPVGLQVLRVSADTWVVRNRFQAGFQLPTHKHTGSVHAFTFSGRWRYKEYGVDYVAGTFIHEPPGSIHTLTIEEDSDILFIIEGAFIEFDKDGNISGIVDGESTLNAYFALCDAAGIPRPDGILP